MINGPRTKFADEGLAITFTFSRITREIFQFGITNLILSQDTKKLSSGKIPVRGVLIKVRYLRLSFFLAAHGHHTVIQYRSSEVVNEHLRGAAELTVAEVTQLSGCLAISVPLLQIVRGCLSSGALHIHFFFAGSPSFATRDLLLALAFFLRRMDGSKKRKSGL